MAGLIARAQRTGVELARSALFVPTLDERKWAGAQSGAADVVILDLEDSIAVADKARARDWLGEALQGRSNIGPTTLVRINDLTSSWAADDLAAVEELHPDGIVIPKADDACLAALRPDGLPVLAIIETAAGLRTAHAVADHPRVRGLVLGGADLTAELGLEYRRDGLELLFARSQLVVASAASGIRPPFDVVHLDVHDDSALEEESRLARSLGMGGKLCIHPAQIPVVNRAFTPSVTELAAARAIVNAYEDALAMGSGVTVLDGRMIDRPVVLRAQRTLIRAEVLHVETADTAIKELTSRA